MEYTNSSLDSSFMNTNISNYSSKSNIVNSVNDQVIRSNLNDTVNIQYSLSNNSPIFEYPENDPSNNTHSKTSISINNNIGSEQSISYYKNSSEIMNKSTRSSISNDDHRKTNQFHSVDWMYNGKSNYTCIYIYIYIYFFFFFKVLI